ncbi:MAG: hypothetical protein ACREPK_10125 [Rhodanobacteraceae bacterium]
MIDDTRPTTAAEDLAYIRRIMEETRRAVSLRGDYFIIWGVFALLGLIGTYLLARTAQAGWTQAPLWGGLMIIAWLATAWRVHTEVHTQRVCAPVGRMLGATWIACSIAIVLVCFVGIPLGVTNFTAVGPTIASIIGVGVFVTGAQMGTPWVRNLSFGWWAGAIAEFIWHGEAQLLIGAIVVLLFYIVPGFVLNAQARKRYAARA